MTTSDVTPNADTPSTADEVGVAHSRWWDALTNEDVVALESLLADDLTFHSPYGTATTKEQFLEALRSGRLEYDSITAEEPLTRIHGEVAIVTGRADIHFRSGGQPRFEQLYYTAVYGWSAQVWRMLAWQSTLRSDT